MKLKLYLQILIFTSYALLFLNTPAKARSHTGDVCIAEPSKSTVIKSVGDISNMVELKINVSNIEETKGHIRLAFYNKEQEDNFPEEKEGRIHFNFEGETIEGLCVNVSNITEDNVTFSILLPKGIYAISAFHDVNDDGEFNKLLGWRPMEPYGFSNDARGAFGAPSFSSAEFDLNDNTEIEFSIF